MFGEITNSFVKPVPEINRTEMSCDNNQEARDPSLSPHKRKFSEVQQSSAVTESTLSVSAKLLFPATTPQGEENNATNYKRHLTELSKIAVAAPCSDTPTDVDAKLLTLTQTITDLSQTELNNVTNNNAATNIEICQLDEVNAIPRLLKAIGDGKAEEIQACAEQIIYNEKLLTSCLQNSEVNSKEFIFTLLATARMAMLEQKNGRPWQFLVRFITEKRMDVFQDAKYFEIAGSFLNDPQLSDVKILFPDILDEKDASKSFILLGNKAILESRSGYFRKMFASGLKESSLTTLEIFLPFQFDHEDILVLKEIVDYIYTNKITLRYNNISAIVQLANFFAIESLLHYCGEILLKNAPAEVLQNPDFIDDMVLTENQKLIDIGINQICEKKLLEKSEDIHEFLKKYGKYLTELNLNDWIGVKIDDRFIQQVCEFCPNLQKLNVDNCSSLGEGSYTNIGTLVHLRSLSLHQTHWLDDKSFQHFAKLENLEQLAIGDCSLLKEASFALIGTFGHLKALSLHETEWLDPDCCRHILGLKNLTALTLENCSELTSDNFSAFVNLTKLKRLSLGKTVNLTNLGIQSFAKLEDLEHLMIENGKHFTSESYVVIGTMKKLKTLHVKGGGYVTDRDVQQFANLTDLQNLMIGNCISIKDAGYQTIGNLGNLTKLELHQCSGLKQKGFEHLSRLTGLKSLTLFGHFEVPNAASNEAIGKLVNLKSLSLPGCQSQEGGGFEHFANLQQLKTLYIGNSHLLDAKGYTIISQIKSLTNITLGLCVGLDDNCLRLFAHLDNLNYIHLDAPSLTGEGFESLNMLPIQEINLVGALKFDGKNLAHFQAWKTLQYLSLSGTPCLNQETGKHLANLQGLISLDLNYHSDLTDDVLVHLKGLNMLEQLNLNYSPKITDAGIAHLPEISLKTLQLVQSEKLTDKALESLGKCHNLYKLVIAGGKTITWKGVKHLENLPLHIFKMYSCPKFGNRVFQIFGKMSKLVFLEVNRVGKVNANAFAGLSTSRLKALTISSSSQVDDKCVENISKTPNLTYLYLQSCSKITDKGIESLFESARLKKLDVRGCSKISPDVIKNLKNKKNTEIITGEFHRPKNRVIRLKDGTVVTFTLHI